jgi:hypothetical protein
MMQFAAMGTNSDIGQENVGGEGRKTRQEQSRLWVLAPSFPRKFAAAEKTWRRMRRCV